MNQSRPEDHYTGEAGRKYHAGFNIPAVSLPWVSRLRAAKLQPFISTDSVVLEYGVGAGWNLAMIDCRRRIGFDVGEHLAALVEPLGIEFVGNLHDVEDGSIDVVICHHVLEHILNPAEALLRMGRLLRSGGRLLLFVPFEKERSYRQFHREEPNHHLYSWNPQTLSNLLEEVGFSVVSAGVGEYGYDRFSSVLADRLHVGEAGFRVIRSAVHRLRPGLEVRINANAV